MLYRLSYVRAGAKVSRFPDPAEGAAASKRRVPCVLTVVERRVGISRYERTA
jgi:hypothetical protein